MKGINFFLLFSVLVNSKVYGQDASSIYNSCIGSTVSITVTDKDGIPIALGSGFVVSPGMVATNFHVIQNSDSGYVEINDSEKKYEIKGYYGVDTLNDLALLSIPTLQAPALKLGLVLPKVGEKIYAIGSPKGLSGSISEGIVSALRTFDTRKLLQISASISPGSSGGPIINNHSEVIGVAVGSYLDGQNLDFAIGISNLKNLIQLSSALKVVGRLTSLQKSQFQNEKLGGKISDGLKAYPVKEKTDTGFVIKAIDIDNYFKVYTDDDGDGIMLESTIQITDIKLQIVIYNKSTGDISKSFILNAYPSKCIDDFDASSNKIVKCIRREPTARFRYVSSNSSYFIYDTFGENIETVDGEKQFSKINHKLTINHELFCYDGKYPEWIYLKSNEGIIIKILDFSFPKK